ncbi:MAG: 1-phosphofructokinase [Candidatus Carbobacillus altaicus]|uniref:Tagatose-6-phosphate kinase n=1 Tax=Candidatus Carbonibacillus altaicus TaxID=2163959 RepID=A0A2R6Y3Y4_9BACL|nr:MAG: 1-phosphofructokinase [Candidatus Carbobacillus altaicus]
MRKRSVLVVSPNPAIDMTYQLRELNLGLLNRAHDVYVNVGGKGINVAKFLASSDVDVHVLGWIGEKNASTIDDFIKSIGLRHAFIKVPGYTRMNIKIVESRPEQRITEINAPGFSVSGKQVDAFIGLIRERLRASDFLVLSGSLPVGAPPDFYRLLIEEAKAHGVKTVLDADGEALKLGIHALPNVIKPNLQEALRLLDKNVSLASLEGETLTRKACQLTLELLQKGVDIVALSMGKDGLCLGFKDQPNLLRLTPPSVQTVSTVGSGDTVVGALIYGLLHGLDLYGLGRFITAAGTATTLVQGSEVATVEQAEQLVDTIFTEWIPVEMLSI